jgi:tetratricopeptide (TPR) repeat protein
MATIQHIQWRGMVALLISGAAALTVAAPAQARFIRPDLENVPLAKILANLEQLAQKNPKDAQIRLNLARAHAMAYALKTDTAEVWKGKEQHGVWFGFTPANVPFTVKRTEDADKLKAARAHLDKAIERYEEALKLAPDNLTARLGLAWAIEQSGNKEKAVKAYREVIEAAWDKEKALKAGRLGGRYVTAEASTYLIPLLDAEKDKEEINILRQRAKQLEQLPRPVTPIAIPLRDGLGAHDVVNPSAAVAFDADGSGLRRKWTWLKPQAGWLVYDHRGDGRISSALQLFGGVSFWMFWENGYQALSALDDNGDGWLTGKELDGLAIWQDRNGDGVCDPGEVKSLAAWGIVAVSCRYTIDTRHPDRIAWSPVGVVLRDGSRRPTFDIVLHPSK